MTREEARAYIIKHCIPNYPKMDKTEWDMAMSMAIEALSREPSEDAVSREAVKHALCKAVHKNEDIPCENQTASCLWSKTRVCDYAREIDALPSAQQKSQWIPCSERLPDIKEHHVSEPCIVYCENGAYGFAELEENIFGQVWWNCERDDEYHETLGEVIAWMPLPELYAERRDGEEE